MHFKIFILIFSSLGYASYEVIVNQLDTTQFLTILLEPASIELEEVAVIAVSAESIWKKAISAMKSHFTSFNHRLSGFYRTTFQENGNFSRLLEAAVYLHGSSKFTKNPTIEYRQMRMSKDLRNDPWTIYDGYLEHLAFLHPVATNTTIVAQRGKKVFQFEIAGLKYQDGEAFYILDAIDKSSNPIYDAQMIVRKSDYAIFKIELYWHPENMQDF